MKFAKCICLMAGVLAGGSLAQADGITYQCAGSVDSTQSGTCAYLNSTVSGYYASVFSNANAFIYIQMGVTNLAESTTGFLNEVTYSQYATALGQAAAASGNPIEVSAVANLGLDAAAYSGGDVNVTSALAQALGISTVDGGGQVLGTSAEGMSCTSIQGFADDCYNCIITVTTPANLLGETGQGLYWDQQGGSQPSSDYDFYSVVEHETDEVLGTSSCIDTTGSLTDGCGGTVPSAVDLFRYTASGVLATTGNAVGQTTGPSPAYFSYDGGMTNGAPGSPLYNPVANGNDYADFIAGPCPGGPYYVQDGTGCTGSNPNITTDGGAEIDILNAVGFQTIVPEPGTMVLFGGGLAAIGLYRRRRA